MVSDYPKSHKFVSDGKGEVVYHDHNGSVGWTGAENNTTTRFRPLPKPPNTQTESAGGGEPVNLYRPAGNFAQIHRAQGWDSAADAWRTHTASLLAAKDGEIARLTAELAAMKESRDVALTQYILDNTDLSYSDSRSIASLCFAWLSRPGSGEKGEGK